MAPCRSQRKHRRKAALIGAASATFGLALVSAFGPPAFAVTIRHDVSDNLYTNLANDPRYAAVGIVESINTGAFSASMVMITPKWAVTAGHVIIFDQPPTVRVGGTTALNGTQYNVAQRYSGWTGNTPDGTDIGFIQLTAPVTGITPASRYFLTNEVGMTATSVGHGFTGTGLTGAVTQDDKKRAFNNLIDVDGSGVGGSYTTKTLFADFDDPGNADGKSPAYGGSTTPLPLEGLVAQGDSGGGMFVEPLAGVPLLAGVHSFVTAYAVHNEGFPDGIFGDGNPNSSYSDLYGSTRISSYNNSTSGIDDIIGVYWKTNTSGSFGSMSNWTAWKTGSQKDADNAPGNGDVVGFNLLGSNFTATLSGNTSNYMILARRGGATIDLNGFTHTLTSTAYEGSIVVARYSGNSAGLTYTNGTVTCHDIQLAQLSGTIGTLAIGSNTTFNVSGNVFVSGDILGQGGNATLTVGTTSTSNTTVNISGSVRVMGISSRLAYKNGTLNIGGTLTIDDNSKVILDSGGNKVLKVGGLSIANNGSLDLNNNDLIIDYNGASPDASIRSMLKSQIIRSTGTTSLGNTVLGYGDNNVLHKTSFSGYNVDFTSEFVKYTYKGDADLDGDVDSKDLSRLATHWQSTGLWIDGDFDYSGFVDVNDIYLMAQDWGLGTGGALGPALGESLESLGLSVPLGSIVTPEPATLSAIAMLSLSLKRPRRRRL